MTIRRLSHRCWAIRPEPSHEDGDPHYDTRAAALAAIREAWDYEQDWAFPGRIGASWREVRFLAYRFRPDTPKPRQADAACWVADCDAPVGQQGTCGDTLGDEDEGPACIHFETLGELLSWLPSQSWERFGADRVVCFDHVAEDAVLPAATPAQQEASGQLRLPGVIP